MKKLDTVISDVHFSEKILGFEIADFLPDFNYMRF